MDGNALRKYRPVALYLVFGVLTTLINIAAYGFFTRITRLPVTVSTVLAWIVSVLFAYATNRKWVFQSEAEKTGEILREMGKFFTARLATGVLDWGIMYVFAEKLLLNDMAVKTVSNIIVILLNYVLSKTVVFRGNKEEG